jgi:hypothetical protein
MAMNITKINIRPWLARWCRLRFGYADYVYFGKNKTLAAKISAAIAEGYSRNICPCPDENIKIISQINKSGYTEKPVSKDTAKKIEKLLYSQYIADLEISVKESGKNNSVTESIYLFMNRYSLTDLIHFESVQKQYYRNKNNFKKA